ncbi:hypothetical protein Tco_0019099 [Tanacetum coccineum]
MSFSKRPDSDDVDSFACPASFLWHTDKNISRDPFPKSTEFNADDYAILVAHPAPFWKFPESFLCLIGMSRYYTLDEDTYPSFLYDDRTEMDLSSFIHVADPTKVRVGERERVEEEARLLDSTVGRVVPLLSVAPARADSELEASVDRLFDEGGSVDQGDSAAGGGQETETEIVTGVRFVADENVVTKKLKRPRKKRQADHGGLLASRMLKCSRSGSGLCRTNPIITSSVSATPEHESGVPADSITGLNIRTIDASERFVISSDSSHHSSTNASGAEADSVVRSNVVPSVMTEAVVTSHAVNVPSVSETGIKVTAPVHAFMFHDSDSTETTKAETVEFNVGTTRQACLNTKVRMRTEYCLSERKRRQSSTRHLVSAVQVAAAEAMEKMHVDEIDALKRRNVVLENEKESLDGKKDSLVDQVHALETTCSGLCDQVTGYERLKEQIEEFQDAHMNIVNDKVAKLDADLLEMALHLEEKFYPHLLTTISGWSRAIEKGMKDGLADGIDPRKAGGYARQPVAPARAESELEASVDRLFDEGGSADQGDSAAGDGQEAETKLVAGVRIIVDENVVAEKPKRPRKKRQAVTDASGSSHPPNVCHADTIGASERFVISSDSSHHYSINASGAEADSVIRSAVVPSVMTEAVITSHVVNAPSVPVLKTGTKIPSPVHAFMFHDSDFTETVKADIAGPSYSAKQDLSMGSQELNSETLHQVFVLRWNVLNDSLLDDYDVSRELVDHLAPPALFSQIREMDYHHLFTEFNVGTAHQACQNTEVRMRTEYCLSERKRLESECEKQADLLKAKDDEVENLKAQLLLNETKATKAARLRAQVSAVEATEKMHAAKIDALKQRNVSLENEKDSLDGKVAELQSSVSDKDLELKDLNVYALETTCSGLRDQVSGYERLKEQIEEFQDAQMNIVNDKVVKLDADLMEMALHLEEYPHLLTTISGRRWLLTHGLKLAIVKCLNSQEYLSALGATICRAIEKGMQDVLSAGINHGKAGRSLPDVVAYNPAAEADYNSALQRLREVDFPLLAELKSHKDASTVDVMDLILLEGPLVDAPRMSDLQPDVEQVTLPIHRPEDQVVLVDPLSAKSLICEASTSDSVPAAVVTTTVLTTTFASASSVPPITIKDYEIVGTDGLEDAQGNGQGNVASFPTVEFEKEELDTTPERDPPS